jgi:O-antigen ligase
MNAMNALLAAIIVYMPYQQHYVVVLDVKGLNLINLIFLVVLAIVLLRGKVAGSAPGEATPLKGRFILFMVALFLAFAVAQARDGSDMVVDATHLKNNIFYMLFYFMYYHAVRDEESIRFLFGAILFAAFLVSLQGMRQALDLGILSSGFAPHRRVTGPFGAGTVGGANQAAAFYVIFVPVFFAVVLIARSRPLARLATVPALMLGLMSTFFTYSRQAYFIIAAQLLYLGLRRQFVLGMVILVALFNYESWAPQGVVERIQMTEQTDTSGDRKLDESTASRFLLWEGGMQMFAERPWGVGLGRFHKEIGGLVPQYANFDAHNGFVLVTAEQGLLGAFAMVFLLAGLVGLARRAARLDDTEETRLLATSFLVATIGAIAANLFGTRIFDGPVMGNYWILAALVARYCTLRERRAEPAGVGVPAS